MRRQNMMMPTVLKTSPITRPIRPQRNTATAAPGPLSSARRKQKATPTPTLPPAAAEATPIAREIRSFKKSDIAYSIARRASISSQTAWASGT